MFSKHLFKKTLKDNWGIWLGITIALVLLLVILLIAVKTIADNPELAGGPGGAKHLSTGIIIDLYFTMYAMLLPMVYIVITGNKLIASQVDKGSLACIMARPVKRNQFSMTQAAYLIGSIIVMFSIIALVGTAAIAVLGLDIAIGKFLLLCLGSICFNLAISGISYLASCIFNFSGKSLLLGAGLPILFFVFSLLASFSEMAKIMEAFKYLTINSLYNVSDITAYSTNMIWQFLILFGIGAACYTAGVMYFKKKDLPL